MEMAILLPSVVISTAISYSLYRFIQSKNPALFLDEDSCGTEPDSASSVDANTSDPDHQRPAKGRYEVFGRDITELIETAFSSPMNQEAMRVYSEHLARYGKSFQNGKRVVPFECLIALTHNLQPIVNEHGEVLVSCFKDEKIKAAPVIEEGTPATTELMARESAEKHIPKPSGGKTGTASEGDFVEITLGDEEETEKYENNRDSKHKPSKNVSENRPNPNTQKKRSAKGSVAEKDRQGDNGSYVKKGKKGNRRSMPAKNEQPTLIGELDIFDLFDEDDGTNSKDTVDEAPSTEVGEIDEEIPPVPIQDAAISKEDSESIDMPIHIELEVCEAGEKLFESVMEAIRSDYQARRAVAHNLAFHRHVIFYNKTHILIEQQYLAQAVIETFKTCFEKDAATIRAFKKSYRILDDLSLMLTDNPLMRDEYWPKVKMHCIEVGGIDYRGYFLRVGEAFVSEYLGEKVLHKMVIRPQIAASAGNAECPKGTPMIHKEIP